MLALELGGVGRSSILAYTFPLWVALLGWPLLGNRPKGFEIAALPVALVGFACLLYPFDLSRGLPSAAFAVGSGISWAIAAVLTKLVGRTTAYDALGMTAWQMIFGCLVIGVAVLVGPHPPIVWSGRFIVSLAFAGAVASSLGWFLWIYALQGLPAGIASFGVLLSPVVGAAGAALQLGERPPAIQLAGFALLSAALVVFSLEGRRVRARARTAASGPVSTVL